ncbi:MAG: helix-turn-helix domain-containing protein [Gammaproteobacteria bacterium]|nr:helix-turn-helix domain-containing protein [Gammaproteobacteria bacterium]MDH3467908.1 helix-turn-helix domain-containing protein [Gammaproteobacteria bacterium]
MKQTARRTRQLGALVRRERRRQGLTQTQLGTKIGLRQATVSRLEAGEPATRLRTLFDTLAALGLEVFIDKRGKSSIDEIESLF